MKCDEHRDIRYRQVFAKVDAVHVNHIDRCSRKNAFNFVPRFPPDFGLHRLGDRSAPRAQRKQAAADGRSGGSDDQRLMTSAYQRTVELEENLFGSSGCIRPDGSKRVSDAENFHSASAASLRKPAPSMPHGNRS